MKKIALLIIYSIFISSCNTWFDYNRDLWNKDISCIELKYSEIDFGNKDNIIEHLRYTGDYKSSQYTISTDVSWITIDNTEGIINSGEDIPININLCRSLLMEGINEGHIIYHLEDTYKKVKVYANGVAEIIIEPDNIDFGSSDITHKLNIKSLSGQRNIFISSNTEWLKLSSNKLILEEYDENNISTSYLISANANRSLLPVGESHGVINIKSEKGLFTKDIPVYIFSPEQDPLSMTIDNIVFTLKKHPYRTENGVTLELEIRNHKYLRTFELNGSLSSAKDSNGKKYVMNNASINIEPHQTGVMVINIKDVPPTISFFNKVELVFEDINTLIIFENLEF